MKQGTNAEEMAKLFELVRFQQLYSINYYFQNTINNFCDVEHSLSGFSIVTHKLYLKST